MSSPVDNQRTSDAETGRVLGVDQEQAIGEDVSSYKHRSLAMAPAPSSEEMTRAQAVLFSAGFHTRTEVMSSSYVSQSFAASNEFTRPIQELATSLAWGAIWNRPHLNLRDRSLMTISMLLAANRMTEFKGHVRGAIRNGVTEDEIREVCIHASTYLGMPAAMEGTRAAHEVLLKMKQDGELDPSQHS